MKLKEYLEKYGVRPSWIAEQLGISRPLVSGYTAGYRRLPMQYWKKLVEITHGNVTMEDLVDDRMKHEDMTSEAQRKAQHNRKTTENL